MRVQDAPSARETPATRPIPEPADRRRAFPRLKLRPGEEEGIGTAPLPPLGGPLGLHRPAAAEASLRVTAPEAARLVDRLIVGHTREGLPEVRMDVAVGRLCGTQVILTAGPGGLAATLLAASESARRVIEAQLDELARALEGRGLKVARCEVATRGRTGSSQGPRRSGGSWEDSAE